MQQGKSTRQLLLDGVESRVMQMPDLATAAEMIRQGFRPSVVKELVSISSTLLDHLCLKHSPDGSTRSKCKGPPPVNLDRFIHKPALHIQATAFAISYEVTCGANLHTEVTGANLSAAFRAFTNIMRREIGNRPLEVNPGYAYLIARSLQKKSLSRVSCGRCEQVHLKLLEPVFVAGRLTTGDCPYCSFHKLNSNSRRNLRNRDRHTAPIAAEG